MGLRKSGLGSTKTRSRGLAPDLAPELVPLARLGKIVRRDRLQAVSGESRARIPDAQDLGDRFAATFRKQLIGVIEPGRAALAIVAVAGQEMDQIPIEQRFRELLCGPPETAEDTLRGDLDAHAVFDPLGDLIDSLPQQRIAFRMGDNRNHAGLLQAGEDFRCVVKDDQIREFDQQITALIDGIFLRILDGAQNIVIAEMKITPRIQADLSAGSGRNFGQTFADKLRLECVVQIGVRGRNEVGGASLGGHADHRHRIFEGFGTIIDAVQHMAVNVDQVTILAAPRGRNSD